MPVGRIRSVYTTDLQAVEQLLIECKLPVEGLSDFFGDCYCVFEIDGRIVGSAGLEIYGDFSLLRSVAVSTGARGSRIAECMIRNRLEFARDRGLRRIYLLTTTADSYFVRYGFHAVPRGQLPEEVKKSKEFSSVCPDSAVVMGLALSNE